jgi:hypothetical protein
LIKDDLTESLLRLHAPIGLDIAARSPEEIALAIMAQVVHAHRRQTQPSVKGEADLNSNKDAAARDEAVTQKDEMASLRQGFDTPFGRNLPTQGAASD